MSLSLLLFWLYFEVRFCHVISCICIAISESGNANSQVSKPKALMRWFSQLIRVSLGGCDVNCMDTISNMQIKKKSHSESYEARRSPMFPWIETAIPSFRHSRCRCTCVLHFSSGLVHEFRRHDVRQSKHNCCEVGRVNCSAYTLCNTERYGVSVIQLGKT